MTRIQRLCVEAGLKAEQDLLASICAGEREAGVLFWQPTDRALVMPKRLARLPGFESASVELATHGWPILLRETGGEPVPQSASTVNIALVYAPLRSEGDQGRIETAYQRLCQPICDLLTELGGVASLGEIEGAFCDGRFNVNLNGRKLVGTAQRWRQSQGDNGRWGWFTVLCCWITSANRWWRRSTDSMSCVHWSSVAVRRATLRCMRCLRRPTFLNSWLPAIKTFWRRCSSLNVCRTPPWSCL